MRDGSLDPRTAGERALQARRKPSEQGARGEKIKITLQAEGIISCAAVRNSSIIVDFIGFRLHQGLALSLMAGEVASLLISRFAVPLIYYMAHARRPEKPAPAADNGVEKCMVSP